MALWSFQWKEISNIKIVDVANIVDNGWYVTDKPKQTGICFAACYIVLGALLLSFLSLQRCCICLRCGSCDAFKSFTHFCWVLCVGVSNADLDPDLLLCAHASSWQKWVWKTEAHWVTTHAAECWHQSKQTEEISRGIGSTNSCQPSLRYMTGMAVARTAEQRLGGTHRHAPFSLLTAQPLGKRCRTDSFL